MSAIPKTKFKTYSINQHRKTPEGKARVKAWQIFSKYIRLRDCNKHIKGGMFAPCWTCGVIKHYSELQAGHFVPGRGNAVLFDEEGVRSQCAGCNIWHHGNPSAYWEKMIDTVGVEKTREIANRRHQIKKYTLADYEEIIAKYTQKIKDLGLPT